MNSKFYILLFFFTLLFFNNTFSQIFETSLDQGTEQNTHLPVYSYSQSIYLASGFVTGVQGVQNLSSLNVAGDGPNGWMDISAKVLSSKILTETHEIPLNDAPTVSVNFHDITYCAGNPAVIIASGADTYSWAPSNGLSSTNTAIVYASPTETTTYVVTGTTNGYSSTDTVKVSPIDKVKSQLTTNSIDLCGAPATIDFQVSNLPSLAGTATWEFSFLTESDSILADWNSSNSYSMNAPVDSVYTIKYKLRSTECPTIEHESSLIETAVGFGTDVKVEHYNCINLSGSIKAINDFGQIPALSPSAIIFENDFSDPGNTNGLIFYNNASITDGRAEITPSATSIRGTMVISPANTVLEAENSMKITFDLTMDQPINNYGTGGGDGIAYSFADDIDPNNSNIHNGTGSKLRLTFDAAENSPNLTGIYLIYGKANYSAQPTPDQSTTLAYYSDISIWKNKTDIPVEIIIKNGTFTLNVNGVNVFKEIALPSAYTNADVSTWQHAFSALTGGDAMRQAIKNLVISSASYEFGITTSATNEPTQWQKGKKFDNLNPGTYYLWMRRDDSGDCQKLVKTIVIENANPFVNLGGDYTICKGDSVVLDAGNPTSTYVWSGSNNINQTYTVMESGVYMVQVTDTLGCTGIGTVTVKVNEPPVIDGIVVERQLNGITVFTVENPQSNYSYAWDFGDGNTVANGAATMSHAYNNNNTEYTVAVTISNDCGDTTITTTVNNIITMVGIDENEQETIKVYPNPSNHFITIEPGNSNQVKMKIVDVSGKVVTDLGAINSTVQLDVSNWSKGVFFAQITGPNNTKVVKLIIH